MGDARFEDFEEVGRSLVAAGHADRAAVVIGESHVACLWTPTNAASTKPRWPSRFSGDVIELPVAVATLATSTERQRNWVVVEIGAVRIVARVARRSRLGDCALALEEALLCLGVVVEPAESAHE